MPHPFATHVGDQRLGPAGIAAPPVRNTQACRFRLDDAFTVASRTCRDSTTRSSQPPLSPAHQAINHDERISVEIDDRDVLELRCDQGWGREAASRR